MADPGFPPGGGANSPGGGGTPPPPPPDPPMHNFVLWCVVQTAKPIVKSVVSYAKILLLSSRYFVQMKALNYRLCPTPELKYTANLTIDCVQVESPFRSQALIIYKIFSFNGIFSW